MAHNRHYIDEVHYVENPLLEQLNGLGWETERLNFPSEGVQYPEDSGRSSFNEVLLQPRLKKALKQINPWLEEDQITSVVRKITTLPYGSLLENNQHILDLLLENTSVSEDRTTGRPNPTVRFIDFENKENNDFYAVAQLKVRIPGTEQHIYPDIVCFLNGLPIVVIECKSPKVTDPMGEAIVQLLRYSEQRSDTAREGNKNLFAYNQFTIATCRTQAKFGTISTHSENYYYRWTDPYPLSVNDITTGSSAPNDQQRLVAGMLARQNLLELVRSFTIFKTTDEGKTIKIVGRYQQYRAVKKVIHGLKNGQNPTERGGIIWHTQGSGKSLTMMFLVRMMKVDSGLKKWKIVFVTDRTDLEDQLSGTSAVIGYSTKVVQKVRELPAAMSGDTADLVMVMIHKFQGEAQINYGVLPEMNNSDRILVMTDEAHRTQYSTLAANLQKAVPNATHIGFTGTPIEKTEKRFKKYIDEYTMRQAVDDGVTLEIVYEGRTNNGLVHDQQAMDAKFIDVFIDYPEDQRQEILGYATRLAYLEAKGTIKDKAYDMIDHYVEHIFPNGFKAQVVAPSRIGCVRYKEYLDEAIAAKIEKLKTANPFNINIALLEKLKTDIIMSGANNDDPELKEYVYTDSKKDAIITDFKSSFPSDDSETEGLTGIVIVTSMLLTGFDAPIEQVMYLDRRIVAHNLLQAIARVNRVGKQHKNNGFIIDYIGIGHHLKDAILEYSEAQGEAKVDPDEVDEILGCLQSKTQELSALIDSRDKVFELLETYGIGDLNDFDAFYDLFTDEEIRFEFIQRYKEFSKAFDTMLPDPDALDFMKEYSQLSEIYVMAGRHFRDDRMSMKGVSDKLRAITDEYLLSQGIDQTVPPLSIMDRDFMKEVESKRRAKSKSTAIEHAIRSHISKNASQDPELYASLAEMLEEILKKNKDNWDQIYLELQQFISVIEQEEEKESYGLDRRKHMPFFRILAKELFDDEQLSEDEIGKVVNLTQLLTNEIQREVRLNGFWDPTSVAAQSRLKGTIQKLLLSKEYHTLSGMMDNYKAIIARIMETAKRNNDALLYD